MQRRSNLIALLALLCCLPAAPAAAQEETIPDTKEAWTARLKKITDPQGNDWSVLYRFRSIDPELSYTVLRGIWNKKLGDALKQNLLSNFAYDYGEIRIGADGKVVSTGKINPHTLDVFELGVNDESKNVQQSALSYVSNIMAHSFENREQFLAWRRQVGSKPLADLARENCRDLFARFAAADSVEKINLFGRISRLGFSSGTYGTTINGKEVHGVAAYGLTAVRRQAALDFGLLDAMKPMLRDAALETSANKALYFLMTFQPGEEYLKSVEQDIRRLIMSRADPAAPRRNPGYESLWFLNEYKSAWATTALLRLAETDYPNNYPWMIINALCSRDELRVVPTLIALLEDCGVGEDTAVNNALTRLTKAVPPQDVDADWWRMWWRKNRRQFAPDVAGLSIPLLHGMTFNVVSIRRKKSEVEIADDPRKTYYLISSGLILESEGAKVRPIKTVMRGAIRYTVPENAKPADPKPPIIAKEQRPGLLVVLTDNTTNLEAQKTYWQSVASQAFGGRYLVALASPPLWDAHQSLLWLTRRDLAQYPNAAFTTEAFMREIVQDVEAKYPIHPDHVFLLGVGAGGQAACACSLEPQTPFRGFLLLGSAFRSAALPPLSGAKNRRYVLLHSPQDKTTPYFVANAAQQSLQKAGAQVKLADYAFDRDRLRAKTPAALAAAVSWLETGRP